MLFEALWFVYRASRIVSVLLALAVIVVAVRGRLAAIPASWMVMLWIATLLPFVAAAALSLGDIWLVGSSAKASQGVRWLSIAISFGPLLVTISATAIQQMTRRGG